MNIIDRKWYKALKFLSKLSIDEAIELRKKNSKKYQKYVSDELEETLSKFGYLTFRNDFVQVVSQSGLQQLRDLEDIRRKDLILIASTVAVIISLAALSKSFGLL